MAESYPSHQLGDAHQLGTTGEQLLHPSLEDDEASISPPPRALPPMPPNGVGHDGYFQMNMFPMVQQQQGFAQQGFPQQGFPNMPGYPFPGQGQQPMGFQNQQQQHQQPAMAMNPFPAAPPNQQQMQPMQPMQQPYMPQQMPQNPMYRQNQFQQKQSPAPMMQHGGGMQHSSAPPTRYERTYEPQNDMKKGKGNSDRKDFDSRSPQKGQDRSPGRAKGQRDGGKGGKGDRVGGKGGKGGKPSRDGENRKGEGKDNRKGGQKGEGKGKGGKAVFGRNQADNLPENCSDLLYDFRVKFRKVELLEIVPHVVEFAKDQYGSRLIQSKLAVCTPDEKQLLYVAIKKEVTHLVLDPFANYVIQKFFEYGTLTQRRGLAAELRENVLELSFHMYGCWVIQRALEFLEGPGNAEQLLITNELHGEVLRLVGNQNGNHVIQKCIEKMPTDQVGFIINSFRGEVKRMARHTYGCRVLQRLIEHCVVGQLDGIVSELVDEVEELAKDEYGNYVIQSIAERSDTPQREIVLSTICEKILDLSTDKYASNVCEKALVYSNDDDRHTLMATVLGREGDADPPLFTMMRDRYANYIIQKMIELATPEQKDILRHRLSQQIDSLRKFIYGKHIVSTLCRVGIVDRAILDEMVFEENDAAPL